MRRMIARAIALSATGWLVALAPAQETIHSIYRNTTSVRSLIHSVERESNSFRADYERHYYDGFVPNWRRADSERKAVQDLDKSLEVVERRNWNGEKPMYLRDDVKKVVERARALDALFRHPDETLAMVRPEWPQLRSDIETLAEVYDLPSAVYLQDHDR